MPHRPEAEDYYAILGVARTASREEIRAAFRARAKELHPDLSSVRNAKEAFQRLQSAYSVLGRPERRQQYDLTLPPTVVAPPVPPPSPPPATAPGRGPRLLRRFALAGLAIPLLTLAIYGLFALSTAGRRTRAAAGADFERQVEADLSRQAASFFGPPPEPAEVEMIGKEGRKHLVARADYQRLLPVYEGLVAEARQLRGRKADLDARRVVLETEGRELTGANIAAVTQHRQRADTFNHDATALRRAYELHAAELEDYFKKVEAAAISGR